MKSLIDYDKERAQPGKNIAQTIHESTTDNETKLYEITSTRFPHIMWRIYSTDPPNVS